MTDVFRERRDDDDLERTSASREGALPLASDLFTGITTRVKNYRRSHRQFPMTQLIECVRERSKSRSK
jgi:hypothetical protein